MGPCVGPTRMGMGRRDLWTPPIPPVTKTSIPTIRATCIVAETVVAP